jgi:hypothetical protein
MSIRCRKCVCYNELAFAAESVFAAKLGGLWRNSYRRRIVWLEVKQFSLLNWVACSETVFAAELCG